MLTSFGDDEALFDAIMAGAAGYVLKQIRGTDLVRAVRTVASGQSMPDLVQAASQLMARLRDQSAKRDPLAGLSGQERRILELIGDGLTNRQIGEQMFLAEKTVEESRVGAVRQARDGAPHSGGGLRGPRLRRSVRRPRRAAPGVRRYEDQVAVLTGQLPASSLHAVRRPGTR